MTAEDVSSSPTLCNSAVQTINKMTFKKKYSPKCEMLEAKLTESVISIENGSIEIAII